ncbi:MAG: DUF975 family protein [Ruminococcaceae bacterium]|nr:DUF975 family protein [Oscillospiraceae bacterium]
MVFSMRARDYRAVARERLQGQWGTMILLSFVYSLIVNAISFISGIGMYIIGGPLIVGLALAYLKVIRGDKPEFNDLFSGFDRFGGNLTTYLLHTLYTFLWSLLFIPIFIKPFSYALTFYIRVDNPDIGADDAITLSRQMMDGYKWKLFCLRLSFIGWAFLSILTLGIGFFFLTPYMEAANAAFYEERKREWNSGQTI